MGTLSKSNGESKSVTLYIQIMFFEADASILKFTLANISKS